MPRYDYSCEANALVVEVRHGVDEHVRTWGELARRAGLPQGETPAQAPVEKIIHAPALSFPRGDSQLKNLGFTKLVRRDDGVYENVTASGSESKVVSRDDASSIAGLNLKEKLGE